MGEWKTRKFTDEQEMEIAIEYVEDGASMDELAKKYNCCKATISKVVHRSRVLDKMERRADSRSRLALIRLKTESADASAKLIRLSRKEREDKDVYADIQLLQQILDRAGVRATKNEDNSLTIKFAPGAGFDIGETQDVEVIKEVSEE